MCRYQECGLLPPSPKGRGRFCQLWAPRPGGKRSLECILSSRPHLGPGATRRPGPRPTWAVRGNSSSSAQAGAGTALRPSSSKPSTSTKRHCPATPRRASTCGGDKAARLVETGEWGASAGGRGRRGSSAPPPEPGRSPRSDLRPARAMTQHKARPTRGSREARAPESARPEPRPREPGRALPGGCGLLRHLHPAPARHAEAPGARPDRAQPRASGAHRAPSKRREPARSRWALPPRLSWGEGDSGRARRHSLCSASERQMQRKIQKNQQSATRLPDVG